MTPEELIECLNKREIPPTPINFKSNYNFSPRDEVVSRGMWALINKVWTKDLAEWIGDRKCLEIMAGHGWLAKALEEHGVDIIATDDYSWIGYRHIKRRPFDLVKKMDGRDAVKRYRRAEVLIVSWPPYNEEEICDICKEWGPDKPIVYIGEGDGGCTATDTFHENFCLIEDVSPFQMQRWDGIHDHVEIGYYKGGEKW